MDKNRIAELIEQELEEREAEAQSVIAKSDSDARDERIQRMVTASDIDLRNGNSRGRQARHGAEKARVKQREKKSNVLVYDL